MTDEFILKPGFRVKFPTYLGSLYLVGLSLMFFGRGSWSWAMGCLVAGLGLFVWGFRTIKRVSLEVSKTGITYCDASGIKKTLGWSDILEINAPTIRRSHINVCGKSDTIRLPTSDFPRGTISRIIKLVERNSPGARISPEANRHR